MGRDVPCKWSVVRRQLLVHSRCPTSIHPKSVVHRWVSDMLRNDWVVKWIPAFGPLSSSF